MKSRASLALIVPLLLTPGCSDANQSSEEATSGGLCQYPSSGEPAKPVDPPPTDGIATTGTTKATLHLEAGDVEVTLDHEIAPCAVNSFISLTKQGFYDNTNCHRVTQENIFIMQCGDPTGTGMGGPGYVMAEEVTSETRYPRGTVAMAKTSQPTSTGSQFFLVYADSDNLGPEYTVIGKMDDPGTDVVAGVAAQGSDDNDVPLGPSGLRNITLG